MPVAVPVQLDLQYRDRLDNTVWWRLVKRIMVDNPTITRREAEQIVDATVGFLVFVGEYRNINLAASKAVSVGWRTFMHYPREYTEFCYAEVGFFVDEPRVITRADRREADFVYAMYLMTEVGADFNPAMWPDGANCTDMYPGAML